MPKGISVVVVVLFVTYACLLGFELVTHKQLYVGDLQNDGDDRKEALCRLAPPAGVSGSGHMEDRGNAQCNGRERQRRSRSARGGFVG